MQIQTDICDLGSGLHVPRAVFVDLEPSVIDEVSFIFIIKGFIREKLK